MLPDSTTLQRFWSKVDRSGGPDSCWPWTGCCQPYGVFRWQYRNFRAHKFAYELTHGPVPEGLCVLHNCPDGDNPACCNSAHLWLGPNARNSADMVAKGRQAYGVRHGMAKLTAAEVADIRARYVPGHRFRSGNCAALAAEYGIDVTTVQRIANGSRRRLG